MQTNQEDLNNLVARLNAVIATDTSGVGEDLARRINLFHSCVFTSESSHILMRPSEISRR